MKKISIPFLLAGMLLTGSCSKDFLDIRPQQSVFTEDVFSSMPTARAAVNGARTGGEGAEGSPTRAPRSACTVAKAP